MNDLFRWLATPPTTGPRSILLLRLLAGGVFFWEGFLKFVYANQGVGRFTRLGFPAPGLTANLIATLEIAGGLMLILGLCTRFASIPFIVEMLVAIALTKVPLLFGSSPLALPASPPQVGIWAFLHETRVDYAQLLTCLFLLLSGPGSLSLDAMCSARRESA